MSARRRAWGGTLLYLLLALPVGAAGAAILFAGWLLGSLLAVTPLVVPVLVGLRAAVGRLVQLDAAAARALLGARCHPPARSPGPAGYWRRGRNVLADRSFWLQQAFLLQRLALGGATAIAELALVWGGLQALAEPIDYRWLGTSLGSWHVDSLGRALLFVPAGVAALALAVVLVRPSGALARALAELLLAGDPPPDPVPGEDTRAVRLRLLVIHAAVLAGVAVLTTVVWAITTRAYFWPVWPILVVGASFAAHAWIDLVELRPGVASRQRLTPALAIQEGTSLAFGAFLVCIWAITSRGYFWPAWPLLVLLVAFGIHAGIVLGPAIRSGALAERIASLETSRKGAVDQQDAELRRIERDLHDGAQARLVALGMSLGMAEQKLESDPGAAAELLRDARQGAHEALEELRDLARGIHPPVLADRGLEAAIAALASRTPLHVQLVVDVDRRPAPPIESAAYFVVAEALTNTGKHARAEHVDIAVRRRRAAIYVEIADDGVGGADPRGSGLTGLARRVEALDGTLEISSPPGGPTTVRAVLPCGS